MNWHQSALYHMQNGNKEAAVQCFNEAIQLHQNAPTYLLQLMEIGQAQSWFDQVCLWGQRLLQDSSHSHEAHFLMGRACRRQFLLSEALRHFQLSYQDKPTDLFVFYVIAKLLYFMGRYEALIRHCQRVFAPIHEPDSILLELPPEAQDTLKEWHPRFYAMIILGLYGSPGVTDAILDTHMKLWAQSFLMPPSTPDAHFSSPSPAQQRRLRIGYISKEFGWFSSRTTIYALLDHHDRSRFEIYGFCDTEEPDAATQEASHLCDHWYPIQGISNHKLYQVIRQLNLDILVDLGGYTHAYRLLLFGMRAAPVQVTGLAFGLATSIPAMDYLISDPWVAPSASPRQYSEKVWHIPSITLWAPPATDVPLKSPPCETNGFLTFGCGNAYNKLNAHVLQTWAKILHKCPYSHLIIKNQALSDPVLREELQQQFDRLGIWPERLHLRGHTPIYEHLALYHDIDVALDPFPFNGGISTCEALWMGVPVITWWNPERTGTGRTILNVTGHPEWIANSLEDYINQAAAWQQKMGHLADLRSQLRQDILNSPLADPQAFTQSVESAYLGMWQRYCETANTSITSPQS